MYETFSDITVISAEVSGELSEDQEDEEETGESSESEEEERRDGRFFLSKFLISNIISIQRYIKFQRKHKTWMILTKMFSTKCTDLNVMGGLLFHVCDFFARP